MTSNDNCSIGLLNTGYTCSTLLKALVKIVLVPYWNNQGTQNIISSADGPFNNAFFTALINQADASQRWFPTPTLKNATNKRDPSIMKTYDDGTVALIQQGPRKFTALMDGLLGSPTLLKQLLSARTVECGFYGIDVDGNIYGTYTTDDDENLALAPIRIDVNSIDPIYNPGEDKDIQGIQLNFTVHRNEIDANLGWLSAANIVDDIDIRNIDGLLDVKALYTNLAHASNDLTVQLNTLFGDLTGFITVKGLLKAQFAVQRLNNTPGAVPLTSVTEETDADGNGLGIYTLVATTPGAAGDIWQITITQNGYNFGAVKAATVTLT